jgi:DNA polymerase III delta prime subunit
MKVIVIAGASSGVGKTTLALALQRVLPGTVAVKIGHGPRKAQVANHFYELGTSFDTIRQNHAGAPWVVIESNAILREIEADLVIYLDGPHPKPSAQEARRRADIIVPADVSDDEALRLAARLGVDPEVMRTIIRVAQAVSHPSR